MVLDFVPKSKLKICNFSSVGSFIRPMRSGDMSGIACTRLNLGTSEDVGEYVALLNGLLRKSTGSSSRGSCSFGRIDSGIGGGGRGPIVMAEF
jgi:hypothetical protein